MEQGGEEEEFVLLPKPSHTACNLTTIRTVHIFTLFLGVLQKKYQIIHIIMSQLYTVLNTVLKYSSTMH